MTAITLVVNLRSDNWTNSFILRLLGPMKKLILSLLILCSSVFTQAAPNNILQLPGVIWGFDFVSENEVLMTTRDGRLFWGDLASRKTQEISGAPQVEAVGQGGLLDVRVRTTKSGEQRVYLTYSVKEGKGYTTAAGFGIYKDKKLVGFKEAFRAKAVTKEKIHFGSRIDFDDKGFLYMGIGDRNERHEAQKLNTHIGKVLRFTEDFVVPQDNPFLKTAGALPEVYSYGHRNPQALFFDPEKKDLWVVEHGPRGGDELNLILPGKNYGWPVVTYGREYWGPRIGEGTEKEGMEPAKLIWTPSIAPGSAMIYRGEKYPHLKGHFFLANLKVQNIRQVEYLGPRESKETVWLEESGLRYRQIRPSPAGRVFYSTDNGFFGELVLTK